MKGSKKTLLVLIDWFVPGYKAGGPIQSCANMCRALHTQYNIFVLTTDTDHRETMPYPDIPGNQWINNRELGVQVFYAEKKTLTTTTIKKTILSVNADVVYLNLLFSPLFAVYPLWLKLKGILKSTVVMCPRGTLYESALSLKRLKKMSLLGLYRAMGISKKITFHATNDREKSAILKYFPGSRVIVADNLPGTKQEEFKICDKEPGKLKCIFIARIVPIKNLLYVLHLLQQLRQQVSLSIAGPAENEDYWEQCKKSIQQLPPNIIVTYLGPKSHEQLKELLQTHHLFVLPTTGENFGHAIFESLLAGRPVLISDQTPWQQLAAANAGWEFSLSQPQLFVEKLNFLAEADQQQFNDYAAGAWKYARSFINNPALTAPYTLLFE